MENNTVLIIDDDDALRELMKHAIDMDGYEVIVAENGQEGLDLFREYSPVVVLLDLRMPVMDGFEFLEELKPKVDDPYSVIVLTGMGRDEDVKMCYSFGINTFLHKPCNIIELRETVKRVFELKAFQFERKRHIDELEATKNSLRQSEERLKSIIQAIQAGIVIVDSGTGRIVEANPAAISLIGLAKEEIVGASFSQFFYPGTLDESEGEAYEAQLLRGNDQTLSILRNSTVVTLDNERCVVESFINITERQENERLSREKRAIEIASRSKTDFLLSVGQKLRAPMGDLLDMISSFMDVELDESRRRLAENVVGSTGELLGLLDDVIDLARIENGTFNIIKQRIDLKKEIQSVVDKFKPRAIEKRLDFVFSLTENFESRVKADGKSIRKIFEKIIHNAIHFTKYGSVSVRVDCHSRNEGSALLSATVSDTGIGMSQDVVKRVFERFGSVGTDEMNTLSGFGFSMALTKNLLALMGGEIGVRSEVGKGTTFLFSLPLDLALESEPVSSEGMDPQLGDLLKTLDG